MLNKSEETSLFFTNYSTELWELFTYNQKYDE